MTKGRFADEFTEEAVKQVVERGSGRRCREANGDFGAKPVARTPNKNGRILCEKFGVRYSFVFYNRARRQQYLEKY